MNKSLFLLISCSIITQNSVHAFTPTWLGMAARQGNIAAVQVILNSEHTIDEQDSGGWTALHHAVYCNHLEVIRLLLEHGANVNLRNHDMYTPLHIAARYGHLKAAELLLEFGGLAYDLMCHCLLSLSGVHYCNTPLKVALYRDHPKVFELLTRWQHRQQARTAFACLLHPRLGQNSPEAIKQEEIVRNILQHVHQEDFIERPFIHHPSTLQACLNNRCVQLSTVLGVGLLAAWSVNCLKNF